MKATQHIALGLTLFISITSAQIAAELWKESRPELREEIRKEVRKEVIAEQKLIKKMAAQRSKQAKFQALKKQHSNASELEYTHPDSNTSKLTDKSGRSSAVMEWKSN